MRLGRLTSWKWWSERLYREEWNIGVLHQSAGDIVRRGVAGRPQWLPIADGVMRADPSCLSIEGGRLLFLAEHMDFRNRRGEVWSSVLAEDASPEKTVLRPWISGSIHLSYPFPFFDDAGRACLTVETAEANALLLWRRTEEGWVLVGRILPDLAAIDATLWRGERWWLFCGLANDLPDERLHLFHAERPEGPWSPHPANPVKIDSQSSRPAGPLFTFEGRLIRPAQDCSRTYGGAVVLNEVEQLDLDGFRETAIRRLEPFGDAYPDGVHTFCPAGAMTLVDGKRFRLRPSELLLRPLRKCNSVRRRFAAKTREILPARLPSLR
jgi:hypothetical protein